MIDVNDDLSSRFKTIETNGAKIFLKCTDPYGFWYVSFEKGPVPEKLAGAYTSSDNAQVAINSYLEQHSTREKKVA